MPAYTNPRPSGPSSSGSGPINVSRKTDNQPKIDMSEGIEAGVARYSEESRSKDDGAAAAEKPAWVNGPGSAPPTETP